jgi:hypothetical protein
MHVNPTRASLMNVCMDQAICRHHSDVVLTPGHEEGLIATNCNSMVQDDSTVAHVPGLNLFCVFMNMQWTYEDGMVLSRTAAKRFNCAARASIYLDPVKDKTPLMGSEVIPHCVCWWQNHFGIMVSQINTIPSGGLRIIALHECSPVNGDKFTTLHGQKGAMTVLDDCFMPSMNGRTADIATGGSSTIKRQTVIQLLEAAHSQCCVENMETTGCVAYESTDHHCLQNHRIGRSFTFLCCSSLPGCTNA